MTMEGPRDYPLRETALPPPRMEGQWEERCYLRPELGLRLRLQSGDCLVGCETIGGGTFWKELKPQKRTWGCERYHRNRERATPWLSLSSTLQNPTRASYCLNQPGSCRQGSLGIVVPYDTAQRRGRAEID